MIPSRSSRARAVTLGVVTSGVLVAGAVPAAASTDWGHSSVTYIYFEDTCRDGIRFQGARHAMEDPPRTYDTVAVAVQPPPVSWGDGNFAFTLDDEIAIPRLKQPEFIKADEGDDETGLVKIGHRGRFTLRYHKVVPSGVVPAVLEPGPMALNLENANPESNVNATEVTDCLLFAAIDVQPGRSGNEVPIGRGSVSVAVLSTDLLAAQRVDPAAFRFGPKSAKPRTSALRDVNGDSRVDLVLTFDSRATGLRCGARTAKLSGRMPDQGGGVLEGSDRVQPTGCRL